MGEKSPCNSILNSKRISSPRDPRSPNQPSVSTPPLRRQQLRGARQSPLRQNGCPHVASVPGSGSRAASPR
ncbi:hypothetical protein Zm00014a_010837 [Zea mays]|uniref:Uncharacterized protein n=2 Tax=Zea mays TaxID=4577 RepID=A0A8J8Y5J8_MAIZE|nr:60S ribosomal protein L18a-2 [Zea mays]PWZ41738.1 hypothetical protein Zm00014a_010837 [Zea mays]